MKFLEIAPKMIGLSFYNGQSRIVGYNETERKFKAETPVGTISISFHAAFQCLFCCGENECFVQGIFKS